MFLCHFIMPDMVADHEAPGKFLLQNSHRIGPETILVSDDALATAVCWFYKRSDVYLLERGGELIYGLHYDDSKYRLLNLDQFRRLIFKNRGTGLVTLVTKTGSYQDWMHYLPEPFFKDAKGDDGFVFAQY